jgi:hypothetical protein
MLPCDADINSRTFRYWHEAEIADLTDDVRYRG